MVSTNKLLNIGKGQRKIIRLSRLNEFNSYWIFLLIQPLIFIYMLRYTDTLPKMMLWTTGIILISIVGLVYQGFEVVQVNENEKTFEQKQERG